MYQMQGIGGAEQVVNLTLYTDAYVDLTAGQYLQQRLEETKQA